MPCGCKQVDAVMLASAMGIRHGNARAGQNGVYELAQAPGCFSPYEGEYRFDSVFVIGLGTEQEKIFGRRKRNDALTYARDNKLRIDPLPAHNLCSEVMLAFFGS